MSLIRSRFAATAFSLFFPIAAGAASSITLQYTTYTTSAGFSGTVTLNAGQSLNMETGAAVSSGGDIAWNGTTLTPVGKVVAADLTSIISTYSGSSGFSQLTQSFLQLGLANGIGTAAPITPALGDVIGVEDNSGNVGKLLVTALSASTGGGGSTTPTITGVQNNYSYLLPGLPNYGIAPGSLFIITGSNLASATTVSALQNPATGIPTSLNGASISVTVGGVTTTPPIYYAIATQIAAVLPSNTPVGTGTIKVTYGTTSASASITVLASALGLDTYYGTGTGLGVATNPTTGALYNYTNSIAPGSTIVLWGSGLGSTGDSDTTNTSTPHQVSNPPTFYIGGVAVTPLYAGRSVYPGVNQINLTVPTTVPTGCGVSVVAVSGSVVSNTVTLPINAGGGVCTDPLTGISGTTIGTITGKSSYNSGSLFVIQETSSGQTASVAEGNFQNVQTTTSSVVSGLTSPGSCTLSTSSTSATTVSTSTGLSAGTITITGPTGSQTLTSVPILAGEYLAQLPTGFIPATGGSFTFTSTAGTNVGAFSVSVAYTNPLVWTNSSGISSIARASGQSITWTGGASGSYVYIEGSSSGTTASASFVCYAPASAGKFTIPSYVLLGLPAGTGNLGVENITTPVSFSASGLDYANAFAGVGFSINATYN